MKVKKITLANLSEREMARREKSFLLGGANCGCVGACLASCSCRYGTTSLPDDFMGVDAHVDMYDVVSDPLSNDLIDPILKQNMANAN